MVGDLLTYARVDTHGQPFAPADCNLLLARALVALRTSIDESGAFVTNGPLPTVNADAAQLAQLFQGLIANAIKRRGDEPPRIHVAAQRTNAHWTFSLSDNGVAVTSEDEVRLYAVSEQTEGGLLVWPGLDLAICRRIVERHGGHIWRESQPGGGVTFYFTLPVENGDDE
jgi:light-regulated signal transduction histidine kinase (bacteriophytochrome)